MNINNDNYEAYFLLYADNELTAAQRLIVEMFVKANPHLQREWNELMSTIQHPEHISLSDKSFLFKRPEDAFIDSFNFEKQFVAYHDGQLNEVEKSFVRNFLKEHPSLQDEFNTIGKAYVSPDLSIEFPDKEALYHRRALVRYGLFMRIAAAAIFIGFVFWLGFRLNINQNPQNAIVSNTPSMENPETTRSVQKPAVKEPILADNNPQKQAPERQAAPYSRPVIAGHTKSVVPPTTNMQIEKNEVPGKQTEIAAMIPIASKNVTPDVDNEIIIADIPNTAEPTNTTAINITGEMPVKELATFSPEPQENNYVFTDIPAENIQRSKLGIFIKKVKRTIDRNNPINRLFNSEED